MLQGGNGGNGGNGFIDYTGTICYAPAKGGPGLWLTSVPAQVQLAGCSLTPGLTGAIPSGNPLQPCPPVSPAPPALVDAGTLTELFADPGELVVPTPLREGQNLTLTLSGAVGSLGFLIASADSSPPLLIPALGGALHLGNPIVVIPLGAIPATGTLSIVFPLPILPHAALTVDYYLQGATCAPVGGCALAGPAVLIVLDSVSQENRPWDSGSTNPRPPADLAL